MTGLSLFHVQKMAIYGGERGGCGFNNQHLGEFNTL